MDQNIALAIGTIIALSFGGGMAVAQVWMRGIEQKPPTAPIIELAVRLAIERDKAWQRDDHAEWMRLAAEVRACARCASVITCEDPMDILARIEYCVSVDTHPSRG